MKKQTSELEHHGLFMDGYRELETSLSELSNMGQVSLRDKLLYINLKTIAGSDYIPFRKTKEVMLDKLVLRHHCIGSMQ